MKPGELYLDALFPLAVRRSPKLIVAPPEQDCTLIIISPHGPVSVLGQKLDASNTNQPSINDAFLWISGMVRVRVRAECDTWGLIIGRRLMNQIVISAFGEPGFSRFLDELAEDGSASLGPDSARDIGEQCTRLLDELESRRPAFRTHARALLTGLLLTIYRSRIGAPIESSSGSYRLAVIIDYIEKNSVEDLRLSHLSSLAGCSPSHFSRLFSQEIGMPVSEFINRSRIRKACLLLRRDDLSITEIAFDVGYNNVSFFNRYFRRLMGMTPREYRRYVRQ